jgi:hypothetical protein
MIIDIYFNIFLAIDMNNKDKKITLNLDIVKVALFNQLIDCYCTFNLKGEFILYGKFCAFDIFRIFGYIDSDIEQKVIWIYSTQTKNNKWECKRFYKIPEDYELISISKYDKVYLFSNDYIYEWNINTEKSVKIFFINKDKNKVISIIKFIFKPINVKL